MTDLYVILVPVLLVVLLLLLIAVLLVFIKRRRGSESWSPGDKVPDSKLLPLYDGVNLPYIDSPLPDSERDNYIQ